jgi:hypothetical protein
VVAIESNASKVDLQLPTLHLQRGFEMAADEHGLLLHYYRPWFDMFGQWYQRLLETKGASWDDPILR